MAETVHPTVIKIMQMLPEDPSQRLEIALQLVRHVVHIEQRANRNRLVESVNAAASQSEEKVRMLMAKLAQCQQREQKILVENADMHSQLDKFDAIRSSRLRPQNLHQVPDQMTNASETLRISQLHDRPNFMAVPTTSTKDQHADIVAAIDQRVGRKKASESPEIIHATERKHEPVSYSWQPQQSKVTTLEDGKDFFKLCRKRLTPESFSRFIAQVRSLNTQTISREEVVSNAKDLFGTNNQDLVLQLQNLLFSTPSDL